MPRFKDYNYDQIKMIPIAFDRQILPGSFEYSLVYLIEHELDLSVFDARYQNDDNGRPAYDPAILLKIILLAYSRGITSSRKIEQLCRENILFMAVSADSHPHFTTIAEFISGSSEAITRLFVQVLMVCDAAGLIGKEMFAIDGCKLPSNASKEWSGTRADLKKKQKKIDRAIRYIMNKHQHADQSELDEDLLAREQKQKEKLQQASRKIKKFLMENEERTGISQRPVQSNITDNESAKMKTSHGVIQGYTAVAAVDAKHQVIVHAEAHGQGQEHGLLEPTIEQAHKNLQSTQEEKQATQISADSGYHNKKALEYLEAQQIDGYIADTGFRSRDPRFKDYTRHKPLERLKPKERFTVEDFTCDKQKKTCRCPAGHTMWLQGADLRIGHHRFMKFQAYQRDCQGCGLRRRCLRDPQQKTPRQVAIKLGITQAHQKNSLIEQMKRKIDSVQGRHIYSQRLGIVEPVFGHITDAIGFKRFSLRGKKKVNAQWQLMALVHNLFKIHRYGWQ